MPCFETDPGLPPKTRMDEFMEEQYPLIGALGVRVGLFAHPTTFVRVTLNPDAKILNRAWPEPRYRSIFNKHGELFGWGEHTAPDNMHYEGFVQGVVYPENIHVPMLHLVRYIMDIDESSAGIPLPAIRTVAMYSHNAAEVMSMYHLAQSDGSTAYLSNTRGYAHTFSPDEIGAFVFLHMPQPEIVYEA